jgi:hypothetical protein
VHRRGFFHGLDLDDHLVFHDHVCPIANLQMYVLVDQWDGLLADNAQAALPQFVGQKRFVGRFQQTGAKLDVDLVCGIDDLLGDFVFCHRLIHLLVDALSSLV